MIQIALLLLFLTACKQQTGDDQEKVIVTKTDTLAVILKDWTDHYKIFDLKTDSFKLTQTDTLPDLIRELNAFGAMEQKKKDLLKYSPDGKQALDLFSYNLILEENELGEMVYGKEADTEVLLLNPEKKISRRLLFVGPSVQVEDGFWLNNHELIIVGQYHEYEASDYLPVYWKVNITRNTIEYHEYNSAKAGLVPDYLDKKKLVKHQ